MTSTSLKNPKSIKWWGWGTEEEKYSLPDPEGFWAFLRDSLGPLEKATRMASLSDISLAPSRLDEKDLLKVKEICGEGALSVEPPDRLLHAVGKSYVDLVRLRQGQVKAAPDAVVYPEREEHIQQLLELAAEQGWSLIPFGGGTSVVGGVEPLADGLPVLALDLRRMDRVLSIDPISHTARIQCGIRGPELEAELNSAGFTLGHFPQSFEFSTLGGWIATRSAGQNSTKYGKIEHMVVSLRLVTPTGILDSPVVPADAVGPSLLQCLIGSEGALGVITEAVMRVHPLPQYRAFAAYLFPDFNSGTTGARNLLQAGLRPAILRLSDPDETALALLLSKSPHPTLKERLGYGYVRFRGFDLENGSLLILIFEGTRSLVSAASREARRHLRSGLFLGASPAQMWMKSRYHHPYLRDDLMDISVMVDTLETAAPWKKLPTLYEAVRSTLIDTIGKTAPSALVFCHLSHAYPDGASLYFTFMARQESGRELEQWKLVKEAATEAILEHGGALSHHHGIGTMHKPWLQRYLGREGVALMEEFKQKMDPKNIMNPGKLIGK